jgi:hypothetical protein
MNFTKARATALVGVLGFAAMGVVVACGGDDTTSGSTPQDGGKDAVVDNNVPPIDSAPPPDTGTDGNVPTLYEQLGGHAGLKQFITLTVTALLKDPQQASYFVLQFSAGGTSPATWSGPPYPGHPSAADLIDCFTDLAGSATGGPETYTTATTTDKLPDGYSCRNLETTHTMFHIPNGVFNDFVTIAAGVAATNGVSPTNIAKLGALLGGVKSQVVDPAVTVDAGFFDATDFLDANDPRFSADAGDSG